MTFIKCYLPKNQLLVTLFITVFLFSCTSTKDGTKKVHISNKEKNQHHSLEPETAEQILKSSLQQNNDNAINRLVKAGYLFNSENKPKQALTLALASEALVLTPEKIYQFSLIKAQSLLKLDQINDAYKALNHADNIKTTAELMHNSYYFSILAKVLEQKQLPIVSLEAQLNAFALSSTRTEQQIKLIWHKLTQLSSWQFQHLVSLSPPFIEGWHSLLTISQQLTDDFEKRKNNIHLWQKKYVNHPAFIISEDIKANRQYTIEQLDNIAIIIPLTGKQQAAGKVIQQGILAAYQHSDSQLHFIDSTTLDMQTLSTRLTELNIDYVIGPLLKKNVKSYIEQLELNTPTLLLNIVKDIALKPHQVSLSMQLEDEAIQAATTLSRRNFKHPMLLCHKDRVSSRIAKTFALQWQKITGIQPQIDYFDKGNDMQHQIKSSLEVDLSQKRIKALDNQIKYPLKSEQRNRRDIDMIYIIGKPLETKLLKPYIDVNTSAFSDIIPIFASSRSHSTQNDKSDKSDLSGLVFTDIPWKLASPRQNKTLLKTSKALWPNRSDNLETFFAMGYDSFHLVQVLSAMKKHKYLRHYGQTGVLTLTDDNILTRSLLWGKYYRNQVKSIELD